MRTTARTTISIDPALLAMLEPHRTAWPGFSSVVDTELRRFLRAQGEQVPPREPTEPLHELARRAAEARRKGAPKKKSTPRKQNP